MCEPTMLALAAIGVSAGSTAAGAIQARQQHKLAELYQEGQVARGRANALVQLRLETEQINQQLEAEREAAALEIEGNLRDAMEAMALAQVTAGEAGAFGLSYEALINEFHLEQSEFQGAVERNLEIRANFSRLARKQAILGKDARFLNLDLPPIPRPDYIGMGLGFLGDALGLWAQGQKASGTSAGRRRTARR